MKSRLTLTLLLTALSFSAQAGVSAAEAAKLKGELTPFGAEKAGNKEGTIPAWTGGYTTVTPGDKAGRRPDPFKDEKPLYSITAANMAQYADKLTDGQKAMLSKHADYRLDVYPTHRTAAAPQWVYDNTFANATRAKMNGDLVEGAFGGIPFPIPKTGAEVMWNHLLRWGGTTWEMFGSNYAITTEGKHVLVSEAGGDFQSAYYFPDSSVEDFAKNNTYFGSRFLTAGPPIRAGEAITGNLNINGAKDQAWVYLAGQRRVRKLPNPCCDTPSPASGGMMTFDELFVWFGRLDRFDWKLVGKREVIIPYNNNRLLQAKSPEESLGKFGFKPEWMRWELHRVWVVEATGRAGQRHQVSKSRYYCDEDTWICHLGDRWDSNNQLWRTLWAVNFTAPEFPAVAVETFGYNDLLSNAGFVTNAWGHPKSVQHMPRARLPESTFTGEALAGEGVR